MFFWKKRPQWRGSTIYWRKRHDGIGMQASFEMILEQLNFDTIQFGISLSRSDRIIKLGIPHGELYHHCNDSEWADILKLLELSDEEK